MEEKFNLFVKKQTENLLKDFVSFLIHHKVAEQTANKQIYSFMELDRFMPYHIEDFKDYIEQRVIDKKVDKDYELAKFWQSVVTESAKHSDMPELIADNAVKKFKEQFLNDK